MPSTLQFPVALEHMEDNMTPCEGPEGEAGAMVPNSQMRGSDTETGGVGSNPSSTLFIPW